MSANIWDTPLWIKLIALAFVVRIGVDIVTPDPYAQYREPSSHVSCMSASSEAAYERCEEFTAQ